MIIRTKIRTRGLVTVFAIGTVVTVNAANIPVTNLDDLGPGSFRQAIIDANVNPGLDIIDLSAIKNPNGPVVTIQPLSPLPPITSPVHIDGSINETRIGLPGDIVLNEDAGFSLSGPGPSLRPGVELDGSGAITTSTAELGFYINPHIFLGVGVPQLPCDDPSHQSGDRCFANAPSTGEIFVYTDETQQRAVDVARAHGIWLKEHTGSTLTGFVINRFSGNGLSVERGGEHILAGNYVGTEVTGTMTGTAVGPSGSPATYLSHDLDTGSPTYFWLDRDLTDSGDGTIAYGNGFPWAMGGPGIFYALNRGIDISNSSDNIIGGLAANDRNVLSGNNDEGVTISGGGADSALPPYGPSDRNVIIGNFIGTGAYGVEALGNLNHGTVVLDAGDLPENQVNENQIVGNVFSDNALVGGRSVEIFGSTGIDGIAVSGGNNLLVSHNHIGTDVSGELPIGNGGAGMRAISESQTVVEGNVFSANGLYGLRLIEGDGIVVRDNHIGTDITGMTPLGNGQDGLLSVGQSQATYENNLIAANGLSGIRLEGGDRVVIRDNYIGTDIGGMAPSNVFANGAQGILWLGEPITPLSGTPARNGEILNNFIANNKLAGIIAFFNEDLLIKGNTVLKNGFAEGLTVPDFGLVDGEAQPGIGVYNQSERVEIVGNWVGVDPNRPRDVSLGNAASGIDIGVSTVLQLYPGNPPFVPPIFAPQHALAASLAGQPVGPADVMVLRNTVAHNDGSGLLIGGDVDDGVTAYCGSAPCFDVFFLLGGPFIPTLLPYDDGFPGDSMGVTVLGNSIFLNEGLGIELTQSHQVASFAGVDVWTWVASVADGVTTNDPDDSDTGPNNLQNYPLITEGVAAGNHLKWVSGMLDSVPGRYRIEFFVNEDDDSSGHGEGEKFAGFLEDDFLGPGPHSFSLICKGVDSANGCLKVKAPTPIHKLNLTATATNLDTGSTSEFSLNFALDSK